MLNTLKFMSLIMVFGLGLSLASCETMEGAGQDIEHAGEAVQDAAN
ncbi:MAG: entericidin [Micavibrio sp.]|nr:entericidin [Micavibrio sp.]HCK32105.1 entericidin [Rhodospirillaceae bacterium]|tara:strand:- start:1415 stop:1552 length:138 start_codon:yes stop_codon:yes gene_type:complete